MIDQTPGLDLAVDVISTRRREGSRVLSKRSRVPSKAQPTLRAGAKSSSSISFRSYCGCFVQQNWFSRLMRNNLRLRRFCRFFRINYGLLWCKDKMFNHCEQLKLMEKMSLDGKRCCSRGKKTRPTRRNVNHVSLDGNDNKSRWWEAMAGEFGLLCRRRLGTLELQKTVHYGASDATAFRVTITKTPSNLGGRGSGRG